MNEITFGNRMLQKIKFSLIFVSAPWEARFCYTISGVMIPRNPPAGAGSEVSSLPSLWIASFRTDRLLVLCILLVRF